MLTRTSLILAIALAACAPSRIGNAPATSGTLKRIAAVPLGAEVTGLSLHGRDFFFNAQHPGAGNTAPFDRATVGVVENAAFDAPALPLPQGAAQRRVTTSLGTYRVLARPGDFGTIGFLHDHREGEPPLDTPDFNALVPTGPRSADLFTNWESRPGGMSRIGLLRSAAGNWQVDPARVSMLDFSAVQGTWMNCFGTLSPWGTPLSSEELYMDDVENWSNLLFRLFFGVDRLARHIGRTPNPYRYGYIVEITDPAGAATPVKRFALGRFSHENAVVMPNRRTVYLSDDGTDTVLFKFIADRPGDLSAGTLYAAKATQRAQAGSLAATTGFDIGWVRLAHATQAEVASWIADYDFTGPDRPSYITDAEIAAWAEGKAADDRVAFLESRKAAAAKGATAEFRKIEGINANAAAMAAGQRYAYVAMSEVTKGMADRSGDVQLAENRCGIVYRLELDGDYDATAMIPAIVGGPDRGAFVTNRCYPENLANPDNLVVRANGDVIVGEDTHNHRNAMIWLWRPAGL